MQETPAPKLLPILVEKLRSGTELRQLVAAGALANARTFGGEDYVGFHTMMALAPGFHMAQELPTEQQPLPVFKVLYRNTNRIQESGGAQARSAAPGVAAASRPAEHIPANGCAKRCAARTWHARSRLSSPCADTPEDAFDALLHDVQDDTEVHRVVLPYRAWDLLGLIGREQAHTLLRQSVRYCVKAEALAQRRRTAGRCCRSCSRSTSCSGPTPGTRTADDEWVDDLSKTIFKATPEQAAAAAAAALAEGMAPDAIGEAISLAANQLILRDQGRRPSEEIAGKPIGSVHGDSIGVHACDSANAWRNMARVARPRNTFACLILGAYQVALDRTNRGGDFLNWEPLPLARHVDEVKIDGTRRACCASSTKRSAATCRAARAASCNATANSATTRAASSTCCCVTRSARTARCTRRNIYRTVTEEFAATRPAFRWRQLCALARVTASEYGRPAPGMAEAKELLKA